jgi:hypothetical protein
MASSNNITMLNNLTLPESERSSKQKFDYIEMNLLLNDLIASKNLNEKNRLNRNENKDMKPNIKHKNKIYNEIGKFTYV